MSKVKKYWVGWCCVGVLVVVVGVRSEIRENVRRRTTAKAFAKGCFH